MAKTPLVHDSNFATWWAMAALLPAALVAGVVVNADRAPTPRTAREWTPEPVDSA